MGNQADEDPVGHVQHRRAPLLVQPGARKKPPECIEYIVVHEFVHLRERHHNDHFRELMDTFIPQWRLHRDELNRAPLAHEDWSY